MSAFSEHDFDANSYDRSRPSYPSDFYLVLNQYHRGSRHCAVDVGCGPGTATFQMAAQLHGFEQLIGTDISPTMIRKADSFRGRDDRVSFAISSSEDFSFLGPAKADQQMLDMVTAVECVHWFDFTAFQSSVAANLRPGGTFAIWGYADAAFLDYPALDTLLDHVSYGSDALGPYWQQPGRNVLRSMLREWVFDDRYTDEQIVYTKITDLRGPANDSQERPLIIVKEMTVSDYANYVRTWSAYHTWKLQNAGAQEDIVDRFVKDIGRLEPQLTLDSKVRVGWNTFYKFARRV